MEEKQQVTIFDVAALAGVSRGTVDRVIHNRGEVSKKTAEKVMKAVRELKFEPNPYAAVLASKKSRLIVCLLPEAEEGEYWDMIRKGCLEGAEAMSHLNIAIKIITYNQYDSASFDAACKELLDCSPSGVVLPPLFKTATQILASELHSRGIPYVYVDTKLDEPQYCAYFGMPMYQSGYLCAALLTERLPADQVKDIVVVRIIRDKSRKSDPTVTRREGFNDYIKSNFPDCHINNIFIDPSEPQTIGKALEGLTGENKLVVMFNSRIHLIADYLREHPCGDRRVIGFDNLDKNIHALNRGQVTLLIAHRTSLQSKMAVTTLAEYIIMRKKPVNRDNYAHMDILSRLNIDNY